MADRVAFAEVARDLDVLVVKSTGHLFAPVDTESLKNAATGQVIRIPSLWFDGHLFDCTYLKNEAGVAVGPPALLGYTSIIVASAFKAGLSRAAAVELFQLTACRQSCVYQPELRCWHRGIGAAGSRYRHSDQRLAEGPASPLAAVPHNEPPRADRHPARLQQSSRAPRDAGYDKRARRPLGPHCLADTPSGWQPLRNGCSTPASTVSQGSRRRQRPSSKNTIPLFEANPQIVQLNNAALSPPWLRTELPRGIFAAGLILRDMRATARSKRAFPMTAI